MNSLVVLLAVVSAACGSLVQVAQPPHHPAIVLDPHGRPLDTAEVLNARALHLQAMALEHSAPLYHAAAVPAVYAAAPALYSSPLLSHSALHLLKKRSLAYAAPAALSHQSRVDVISSPAVVSHAVHAPVVAAYAAPAVYAAPAAVSHQSRVDYRSSPALLSHSIAAPVLAHASPLSYSVLASPYSAVSHGHYLKKRSLASVFGAWTHAAPAAVSHQSRVDVRTSPAIVSHAAPVVSHAVVASPVVSHAVVAPAVYAAPAAVSHQSRVDVHTSPAIISHAAPVVSHAVVAPAVYAAPAAVSHQSRVDVVSSPAHLAVSPLAHSAVWGSPLAHSAHGAHASLW